MIKIISICVIIVAILFAVYDIIGLNKSYKIKPKFFLSAIQITIILLILALIVNIIGILVFKQYPIEVKL